MSTDNKRKNGRFTKGDSGNPSGRPRGSPNKATLLMAALLEGESEQLIRKVIELAKTGDTHALRLCLDRLMPPGKDRLVHFDLPPIRGLVDISLAMASMITAISEGQLTVQEGEILSRIFAEHSKVLTAEDVERRLQKLEQGQSSGEDDVTIIQD